MFAFIISSLECINYISNSSKKTSFLAGKVINDTASVPNTSFIQWKECWDHSSTFIFNLIFLVGNQDMHKSLDEFEFRSDPKTDYGVSCP